MIKKFWSITQSAEIEEYIRNNKIPIQVKEEIIKIISIMDYYYGIGRDVNADGGYVAMVNHQREYQKVLKAHHLKEYHMEFRDELCRTEEGIYYADLYIATSDFGVTIIWFDKKGEQS